MEISVTAWKSTSREERQGSGIRQKPIIRRRVISSVRRKQGGGATLRVEPALEDEGGGELVDPAPRSVASRVLAGGIERSVGLGSGEALVPEVDSEGGVFWAGGIAGGVDDSAMSALELIDEVVDALGLAAAISGEVQRVPDDDACATVAAGEAEDRALIAAGLRALDGQQRLGDTEGVG